jgi:hypothetical protein
MRKLREILPGPRGFPQANFGGPGKTDGKEIRKRETSRDTESQGED